MRNYDVRSHVSHPYNNKTNKSTPALFKFMCVRQYYRERVHSSVRAITPCVRDM